MPASVSAKIEKHQSSSAAAPMAAPSAAVANAENAASVAAAAAASGPASAGGVSPVDNSSPIRQALVIIEHKIRNLEKRKAKLETYRDLEKSGKELNSDMKTAVSKYGEVAQTLEFAREFSKQILLIATTSEKELKKKQKKEETARKQADIAKIREVLIVQDILSMLEDDTVRDDFSKAQNGACKVDQSTLELLDKYYLEVTPRRPESHEETPFKTVTARAADHLLSTVEAKPKSFSGEKETYADIRTILKDIQKSGYFDKAAQPPPPPPTPAVVEEPATEDTVAAEVEPVVVAAAAAIDEAQTGEEFVDPATIEPDFQMAPAADAVPAPAFPPQPVLTAIQNMVVQQMPMLQQPQLQHPQHIQPQQPPPLNGLPGQMVQSIPLGPNMVPVAGVPATITVKPVPHQQQPQNQSIHPAHQAPTTVRAVEQAYFKQHQYITQMRPLAEVVNAQNFFFLQDSELDGPDVMAPPPTTGGFPAQAGQISPNLQQHPSNPNIQNQQQQQQQHMQHLQQQQQHQPQHHPASGRSPQQQSQVPLQQQQQPQIPSQPFANQPFPNVISGAPIFPGTLKPGELSQSHIPGFANANAPIPIPLLTQQPGQPPQLLPSQQQQQQQQQQLPQQQTSTNVLQQQQTANTVNSVNAQQQQQLPSFPSQQQTGTGFLPLQAIVANSAPLGNNQPASSSSLATVKINQASKQQQQQQQPIPDVETRAPEITEWKPEDAVVKSLPDELSSEWQGQYFQSTNVEPEVSDWNDDSTVATAAVTAEESNAWPSANGQQRFPYRNQGGGGGGYNSGRANNNRSGTGSRNAANAAAAAAGNADSTNNSVNNNTNGGYRNRSQYQQANGGGRGESGGGRQQQQQAQSTTGSGSGNGTFYRNNETYYQNGNSGGGGGGYRGGDKSGGGGYRDNKQQDGYRGGNNFRSRDASGNTGAVRGNTGGLSGGRSNNRYNSNSAERGQSTGSRSNTNTSGGGGGGRNEPSPVGGGQTSRPVATTTKQHTVYGGGPRPSGARQTVNV